MNVEKIKAEKPIQELIKFSIINIDKPSGPASFSVSQFVKKLLNVNKTSHFGTLDPMVSGVLPVGIGRACRLNEYFMHRNKEYIGIMRLHEDVADDLLRKEIKNFIGKIVQMPPVRSNVKRAERIREILRFEIIEREGKDVVFISEVQAGTYIRKLIDDLGKKIGGAHMLELRRTRAGIFEEKKSVNLYDFEKAVEELKKGNEKLLREIMIPGEIVCSFLQNILIKKEVMKKCLTGSPIFENFVEKKPEVELKEGEKVCVICEETLIGCYRATGRDKIIAIPEFVLN